MNFYLLDAGGPALLFVPLVAFMLICGFLEGLIIFLFKINKYWASFGHALIINIISLIAGFILWPFLDDLDINTENDVIPLLLITWVVTVLIEGVVLKLLNNNRSLSKIFTAVIVMNLITYIILYFFIEYLQ